MSAEELKEILEFQKIQIEKARAALEHLDVKVIEALVAIDAIQFDHDMLIKKINDT